MSHEHSFATPAPAGLGALAIAVFGFGAVYLGLVDISGYPLLAAWLFGGFIVQITVAVMELKDKNITGGNVFLFFAAFFMLAAAIGVFLKWYMVSHLFSPQAVKTALDTAAQAAGVKPDMLSPEQLKAAMAGVGPAVGTMVAKAVYIEGWMWLACATWLTLIAPAYLKGSSLFFLAVVILDVILWLLCGLDTGWYKIGSVKLTKMIVGYLMIAVGFIALYFAGATVCNTVYARTILPVSKPLIK